MIREAFPTASKTGKVFVVKTWVNENSSKDQVSVQFAQEIDVPAQEGSTNLLVAMAQGIENAGKNMVTAIFSVKKAVALKLGLLDEGQSTKEFTDTTTKFASDFFGIDINIEVKESHTPNPYRANHEPKINPSTGEVVTSGGNPVYRETALVQGAASHVFLTPDRSTVVTGSQLLSRVAMGQPTQ